MIRALALISAFMVASAVATMLSAPRSELASAALRSKGLVFFAGGRFAGVPSTVVDVFTVGNEAEPSIKTATLLTGFLSEARYGLAGAAAGDVVAFAGGMTSSGPSATVDVLDTRISSPYWQQHVLFASRGAVFGAGAGRSILFGSTGTETAIDVLNVDTLQWHRDMIPDQCYRAAAKEDVITLLCKSGVRIFSESSRNWTLVRFTSPLTSLDLAAVGSAWVEMEKHAMDSGGLALLSASCPESHCGAATVDLGSNSVAFVSVFESDTACDALEVEFYTGPSASQLTRSTTVALKNPRVKFAVAPSQGTVVIAGGSVLSSASNCASPRLGSSNIDAISPNGSSFSQPCFGTPSALLSDVFCEEASVWATNKPLTIAAHTVFDVTYPLSITASVVVGTGALLIVREYAHMDLYSQLALEDGAGIRLYRGAHYPHAGNCALSTNYGFVYFTANNTVHCIKLPHVYSGSNHWTARTVSFITTSTVSFFIDGEWPRNPGVYSWPLLVTQGWTTYSNRSSFAFKANMKWDERSRSVSRYTCDAAVYFLVFSNGGNSRSWCAQSEIDGNCGIYADMGGVGAGALVLGALVVAALWFLLRPPPFTSPAPPLAADKEETCAICLQPCDGPVVVRCKHRFCEGCIEEWASVRNTCPICRAELRTQVNRSEYGKDVHYGVLGSYLFLGLAGVTWIDVGHAEIVTVFSYVMFAFVVVMFALFFVTLFIKLRLVARQLDEAQPHSFLLPWFPMLWHTLVPVFALALLLLSFAALQYMNVSSLTCAGSDTVCWNARSYATTTNLRLNAHSVNTVGWGGYVEDYNIYSWSEFVSPYLNQSEGIQYDLAMDGRVTAFGIIKFSIHLVMFVAVALFVLSATHWLCVGRLRHLAYSRRIASLALPCVMVLAFVALVAAAVSAGLVRAYGGEHNYKPEEHLNIFKAGHACLDVAAALLLLLLVMCTLVSVLPRGRHGAARDEEQEMQVLRGGDGGSDDDVPPLVPIARGGANAAAQSDEASPPSDAPHEAGSLSVSNLPLIDIINAEYAYDDFGDGGDGDGGDGGGDGGGEGGD